MAPLQTKQRGFMNIPVEHHDAVKNAASQLHEAGCTTCGSNVASEAVAPKAVSAPVPQQEECHTCGH